MAYAPALSHFVWEMGCQATWSRSSRGETVALGAHRSRLLMMADGLKGSRILLSPVRRLAWIGRCAWWKVERGLDSLSMPS